MFYAFAAWMLLTSLQNAMNAAEITDKLGLHSLRQRAWVSSLNNKFQDILLIGHSTFNPPVLPLEMVFMKVWSGSHKLSERPVTSKFGILYLQFRCLMQAFKQSNVHITTSPYRPLVPLPIMNHLCPSGSTSTGGARVVIVR